jgi:hypothetical protein
LLGEEKNDFQVPLGGGEWTLSLIVAEKEGIVSL